MTLVFLFPFFAGCCSSGVGGTATGGSGGIGDFSTGGVFVRDDARSVSVDGSMGGGSTGGVTDAGDSGAFIVSVDFGSVGVSGVWIFANEGRSAGSG